MNRQRTDARESKLKQELPLFEECAEWFTVREVERELCYLKPQQIKRRLASGAIRSSMRTEWRMTDERSGSGMRRYHHLMVARAELVRVIDEAGRDYFWPTNTGRQP